MKTLVIYNSKTGFTKKYAQWISEEIKCELISLENVKTVNINSYDTVVFTSYFYVSRISKLDWFRKQKIKNKIILVNGACPTSAPEIESTILSNFKDDFDKFKVFYAQGGLCYEKMGFLDKILMSFRKRFVKKTYGENSEEYIGISNSFDASSKDMLSSLYYYIEQLNKNS